MECGEIGAGQPLLGGLLDVSCIVASKIRRNDNSVEITIANPDLLLGRPVLIVDDVASSGGTLNSCARAVLEAGASSVDVIVVHALFSS